MKRQWSGKKSFLAPPPPWVREQVAYDSYYNTGTQLPAIQATEAGTCLVQTIGNTSLHTEALLKGMTS